MFLCVLSPASSPPTHVRGWIKLTNEDDGVLTNDVNASFALRLPSVPPPHPSEREKKCSFAVKAADTKTTTLLLTVGFLHSFHSTLCSVLYRLTIRCFEVKPAVQRRCDEYMLYQVVIRECFKQQDAASIPSFLNGQGVAVALLIELFQRWLAGGSPRPSTPEIIVWRIYSGIHHFIRHLLWCGHWLRNFRGVYGLKALQDLPFSGGCFYPPRAISSRRLMDLLEKGIGG
ncbi:hypothetical protein CDAR_116411 [Caerostris darwini]|uniref:Uncharacterized protein n=1 Tax=Caerostris darwini TaxID=1538125 RepID=A0AAV4WNG6_9ARAC|nr:hypothetical protein CDAR_116411 [Caerostris darwini]